MKPFLTRAQWRVIELLHGGEYIYRAGVRGDKIWGKQTFYPRQTVTSLIKREFLLLQRGHRDWVRLTEAGKQLARERFGKDSDA